MEQSERQHSEGVQQGVCGLSLNTAARFLWSMVKCLLIWLHANAIRPAQSNVR